MTTKVSKFQSHLVNISIRFLCDFLKFTSTTLKLSIFDFVHSSKCEVHFRRNPMCDKP